MLNISSRGCFFCFFLYFGCRGSGGPNIISWGQNIILPFFIQNSGNGYNRYKHTIQQEEEENERVEERERERERRKKEKN